MTPTNIKLAAIILGAIFYGIENNSFSSGLFMLCALYLLGGA